MSFANIYGKDAQGFVKMVEGYAIALYGKDAVLDPLERDLKKAQKALAALEETGKGVLGTEDAVKGLKDSITALEGEIKKARAKYGYDFASVKGLAPLRKGWKYAETRSEKEALLNDFFTLWGVRGSFLDLVDQMGGKRCVSRRVRVLEAHLTADRSFSNALFMGLLVDALMECGLIKETVIPEELREVYRLEKEEADKRRAEKKAARAAERKNKNRK